jgi:hypothetical protein
VSISTPTAFTLLLFSLPPCHVCATTHCHSVHSCLLCHPVIHLTSLLHVCHYTLPQHPFPPPSPSCCSFCLPAIPPHLITVSISTTTSPPAPLITSLSMSGPLPTHPPYCLLFFTFCCASPHLRYLLYCLYLLWHLGYLWGLGVCWGI